jgi:hypothetical protein
VVRGSEAGFPHASRSGVTTHENGWISLGISGILSGILLVANFVDDQVTYSSLSSSATPTQVLAFFESHQNSVNLVGSTAIGAAVLTIPFFVFLGAMFRFKWNGLAQTASFLWSFGATVVALSFALFYGILNGVAGAPGAPSSGDAAYQVGVWIGVEGVVGSAGYFIAGLSLVLFGGLIWKSGVLPNWLAIVSFVGGVVGMASIFLGSLLFLLPLLVLEFGIGIIALRRSRDPRGFDHLTAPLDLPGPVVPVQ